MLRTISDIESELVNFRCKLGLPTNRAEKLKLVSRVSKTYTCNNCRGTTKSGDIAVTGQFITEQGDVYALCQKCTIGLLNEQGYKTTVVITSNLLIKVLENAQEVVNKQRKIISSLVNNFTEDKEERKKLKKKYKNKLDIIHTNLDYILINRKGSKCFVCKESINTGDTSFSKKIFVVGSRRQYSKKVCLSCTDTSIQEAINDNEKVIESIKQLLT